VWKHVLTAKHRRLKEELELDKVIQAAVILGASEQQNMQSNLGQFNVANTEVGQFDRHETGDYEMRTHSDGYPDSLDSMLDHDLKELGRAINLFIDSRESGSDLSSNGVAAAMIWEETDESVSEEDDDEEKRWVAKKTNDSLNWRSQWYPFGSKEASHVCLGLHVLRKRV
jgi:hypothetical protein